MANKEKFEWKTEIKSNKDLVKAMKAMKDFAMAHGAKFADRNYSKNFQLDIYYVDNDNKAKVNRYSVCDGYSSLIDNTYSDLASYTCNTLDQQPIYRYETEMEVIFNCCNQNALHSDAVLNVLGDYDWDNYIAKKSGMVFMSCLDKRYVSVKRAKKGDTPSCDSAYMRYNKDTYKYELRYNWGFIIRTALENSFMYDNPEDCLYDTFAYILCHEISHMKYAHCMMDTIISDISKERHNDVNIAEDIYINDTLSKIFTRDDGKQNFLVGVFQRKTQWTGCKIKSSLTENALLEALNKLTCGNKDRSSLDGSTSYRELPSSLLTKRNVVGDFKDMLGDKIVTIDLDLDPMVYTDAGYNTLVYTKNLIQFIDTISDNAKIKQEKATKTEIANEKKRRENAQKDVPQPDYDNGYRDGYYNTMAEKGILTKDEAERRIDTYHVDDKDDTVEYEKGKQAGIRDALNTIAQGAQPPSSSEQGNSKEQEEQQQEHRPNVSNPFIDDKADKTEKVGDVGNDEQSGEMRSGVDKTEIDPADNKSKKDDSNSSSGNNTKEKEEKKDSTSGGQGDETDGEKSDDKDGSSGNGDKSDDEKSDDKNGSSNGNGGKSDDENGKEKKIGSGDDSFDDSDNEGQPSTQDRLKKDREENGKDMEDIDNNMNKSIKDKTSESGDGDSDSDSTKHGQTQAEKDALRGFGNASGVSFVNDDAKQWRKSLASLLAVQLGVDEKWNSDRQSRRIEGEFGANEEIDSTKTLAICIDCSASMGHTLFRRLFECVDNFLNASSISACDIHVFKWGQNNIEDVRRHIIRYTQGKSVAKAIAQGGRDAKGAFQFQPAGGTCFAPMCQKLKRTEYDCVLVCTDMGIADENASKIAIRGVRNRTKIGWVCVDTDGGVKAMSLSKAKTLVKPYDPRAIPENRIICPRV